MKNSFKSAGAFLIALAMLSIVSASVAADFSQRDWRYVKDITLPPGIQPPGLVETVPDKEVFAGAAPGLADLRVISSKNEEIPYKLEIRKGEQQRTSFSVSILDKGYVPGSYDTFTANLGETGILHNEIEIRTPANDFRRQASVEASADGASWMLIAEQTIYAFTVKERGFTTRNTAIRYPESSARYLRVKIADNGEGSLGITGATVFYVKETPAREVLWPASVLDVTRQERRTMAEIDLGAPGLPSYRLAVSVPDVNFVREVAVESSTDRSDWRTILSRAEIYAFDTPKFTGKSLSVTYPETTSRYLRLVIRDEDSPPLTVQGVEVWGLSRRLVFAADPQQSYRLYYGNPEARRPSYDIERVFPYLPTENLPVANLSPQGINANFVEERPPVSERFPWLFPVVIAVAAVIVALLLLVIFRQVRKALPPPE